MSAENVLVTGVEEPLGRTLAERMATRADVEIVIGAADTARSAIEGVEVITSAPRIHRARRPLAEPRRSTRSSTPTGDGCTPISAGTAAVSTSSPPCNSPPRPPTTRPPCVVSSWFPPLRVYPASSRAPLLHPESEELHAEEGSLAASLLEAEGFVRDLATTNPNLSASILRLADLAGPDTNDTLGRLLSGRVVPAIWGFDPAVQLLHVDDAVAALEHAADHELAGVYNVASHRLIRWRRAARLAGKPIIELPFVPPRLLTAMVRWAYRLNAGDDVLDVLRYGRRAATDALHRSGFQASWTAEHCARRSPWPRDNRGVRLAT